MTKTKIVLFTVVLAVILASCSLVPDLGWNSANLDTLGDNEFYAQNMSPGSNNGRYYKVTAELLTEGDWCVIWAEKGSGITRGQAREFAHEYDTEIRSKIVETFSKKDFYAKDNNNYFDNMLDYANWLAGGNNNGKLTILLLDIKDAYKVKTDPYVAGYFFSGNFFQKGKILGTEHYSNGLDMIYVDTNPGLETETRQTYATFAHELQHLISYVTCVQMDRKYLDTWIDEGLSSQAEYIYLGENPAEKCAWYSSDIGGTLSKGNNFFVWGNRGKEDPLSNLADYSTVYLFFRWLSLQKGSPSILLDIETADNYDYRAVTSVAKNIKPAWNTWEPLLRTWLAANCYPENNSYGYIGDEYLKGAINVKQKSPNPNTEILLYPGEGVYSVISSSFSPPGVSGTHIRYAGLTENSSTIDTVASYSGDILLTFNANTDNDKGTENGALTGVPLSSASQMTAGNARAVAPQSERLKGPYVIDARDVLGRSQDIIPGRTIK
jgi:hypothetical protein